MEKSPTDLIFFSIQQGMDAAFLRSVRLQYFNKF